MNTYLVPNTVTVTVFGRAQFVTLYIEVLYHAITVTNGLIHYLIGVTSIIEVTKHAIDVTSHANEVCHCIIIKNMSN